MNAKKAKAVRRANRAGLPTYYTAPHGHRTVLVTNTDGDEVHQVVTGTLMLAGGTQRAIYKDAKRRA